MRLFTRSSERLPYSAPHASSACTDIISLSTAAIVAFIMSQRLDALSRNPRRTSFISGASWVILLGLTIVFSFCRFLVEPTF